MYRIVTFCIATLIAGSMFVASPIHAGDTKDPADVKLPVIEFDGKKIDEALATSLAKGELRAWANCSSTKAEKDEYGLVASGACIALFVGDADRYSIYVLRDTRCYRRATTCYAGYRRRSRVRLASSRTTKTTVPPTTSRRPRPMGRARGRWSAPLANAW